MSQASHHAVTSARDWSRLSWIALTDKLDAVRIYDRLGLHSLVLHGSLNDGACTCGRPDCSAPGKHPVEPGWQRAAFDLGRADRLLRDDWRRNVGLRMGRQPCGRELIALDVDGDRSLLAELERANGALPPTLTARTARGLHLLFWLPPGLAVKNRVRLAPGVDVRAEGGQIVVAPSRHVSGTRYEWLDVREPAELPR